LSIWKMARQGIDTSWSMKITRIERRCRRRIMVTSRCLQKETSLHLASCFEEILFIANSLNWK
jgi:hypothetical protein